MNFHVANLIKLGFYPQIHQIWKVAVVMAMAMAIGCLALYVMNMNIVPTNGMGDY